MARFTARQIHKQMYPATYNFKDDDAGAEGTAISWVDNDSSGASAIVELIALLDGHRKVLKATADAGGDNADASNYFVADPQSSGVVEWWQRTDNAAQNSQMRLVDGGSAGVLIALTGDQWTYYDGAAHNIVAAADDTWYHITVAFECGAGAFFGLAADTFYIWINGIQYGPFAFWNAISAIDEVRIIVADAVDYSGFYDAISYSWDTNYNSGDNIFWRNLKDQDSAFEAETLYTSGSSIGYVDDATLTEANCTILIIPSFDEHKKILEMFDNNAAGNADWDHDFASGQTSGTIEWYWKTSDATLLNRLIFYDDGVPTQAIILQIDADVFNYYDGAVLTTITGVTPADDTWYHIKLVFDCSSDTFDVWIDNVKRLTAGNFSNATANIANIRFQTASADSGYYTYYDAISYSWTSGNQIADNRTFEYHTESYDDITSNVAGTCSVVDNGYNGSTAFFVDDTTLTIDELHFIQLYDENSDLRFEGNISRIVNPNVQDQFPLTSFNNDELSDENSYTASSAEDVNASLLAIHTNISQVDGRLIYYTLDEPAGNLTPNFRNKPKSMGIRWFAIHGAKVASIEANGRFTLDDDRNPENGAATISSTTGEILAPPTISKVKHQINYVEVRGAIDPDTGTPFSGISQDATTQADGTGIKRYFKRFRELQSDTDCSNRATQIRTGSGFEPTIIEVELRGIYAIPGEIINFAYSPLSFSATNCYVESVIFNLVQGTALYRLNTGIFDVVSMNTPGYTMADETADDIAETLYNTDIVTLLPHLFHENADEITGLIRLDAVGEIVYFRWLVEDEIDPTRDITIRFGFFRNDANNDTVDITKDLDYYQPDNSDAGTVIWNNVADTFPITANGKYNEKVFTVSASDISAGAIYAFNFVWNEANREIWIYSCTIKYYIKRSIS